MTLRRAASAVTALVVVAGLGLASPARAGGSWLSPERERYEPGEDAMIVGYTSSAAGREAGPFYGYLRRNPGEAYRNAFRGGWPFVHPTDQRLGELQVEATGRHDWAAYRLVLSFAVPADLAPGAYEIVICNDPCDRGFGDVIGATVYVGVNPPEPLVRQWPREEPAVAGLADDAYVWVPGHGRLVAADLRQGRIRQGRTTASAAPVPPREVWLPDGSQDGYAATTVPAPPSGTPDVRLSPGDDEAGEAAERSGQQRALPGPAWLAWLAGSGAAIGGGVALRGFGARRKLIRQGKVTMQGGSRGQSPSMTPRWSKKAVRS